MMEDKATFVDEFGRLLARNGVGDVVKLEYIMDKALWRESVIIHFRGGGQRTVNVSADSIPAMIRDIMKHI